MHGYVPLTCFYSTRILLLCFIHVPLEHVHLLSVMGNVHRSGLKVKGTFSDAQFSEESRPTYVYSRFHFEGALRSACMFTFTFQTERIYKLRPANSWGVHM